MKIPRAMTQMITCGLVVGAALLTGCSSSDDNAITTTTVNGMVQDGPVANAVITLTDTAGHSAITQSDDQANWTFNIPSDWTLPVSLTSTGGTDLVTGEAPTFPLKSAMTARTQTTVNINAFSTLIVEAASKTGVGLTLESINAVKAEVVSSLNFGLPSDVDPINTAITSDNITEIIKADQALSEMIKRTSLGATGGMTDIVSTIDTLAADLTDGVIDGKVATGVTVPTNIGTVAASSYTSQVEVLTETLSNTLEVMLADGSSLDAATTEANMNGAVTTVVPGTVKTTAEVKVTAEIKTQTLTAINVAIALANAAGGDTTDQENLQAILDLVDDLEVDVAVDTDRGSAIGQHGDTAGSALDKIDDAIDSGSLTDEDLGNAVDDAVEEGDMVIPAPDPDATGAVGGTT